MTEAQEILQKYPARKALSPRYAADIYEAINRYKFDTHSAKTLHEICLDAIFEPLYNKYRSVFFDVLNGKMAVPNSMKRSYLGSFDIDYPFYKQVTSSGQKQFKLQLPPFLITFAEYMKMALGEHVGTETMFRILTERILIQHFQYYLKAIYEERAKVAKGNFNTTKPLLL